MTFDEELDLYHGPDDEDAPLVRPTWMKVAAVLCLVAALALIIIGMIP